MLELQQKTLGEYETNCYLLIDSNSQEAVLIDVPARAETILAWVAPYNIKLIALTHGHADHVGALDRVQRALAIPAGIHPADAREFGIKVEQELKHGASIRLGQADLEIIHIPGHTPGSVAIKIVEQEIIRFSIVGDAIFPGGPGHTSSNQALRQILDGLAGTVFTWPDEVRLYPGHGNATTVGDERIAFEAFHRNPLPPELYGDVAWR